MSATDVEQVRSTEDCFTESRQKLSLLIDYADARSTAEYSGTTCYEPEAWYHLQTMLMEISSDFKTVYEELERVDKRNRELTTANAALTASTTTPSKQKRKA